MTQEEKQLLLQDLCARLPYKIMVKVNDTQGIMDEIDIPNERIFVSSLNPFLYGEVKASWFTVNGDKIYPYLRPMSSMTGEELKEFKRLKQMSVTVVMPNGVSLLKPTYIVDLEDDGDGMNYLYDWLNTHHFDYRGLIPKGLALQALEGMY